MLLGSSHFDGHIWRKVIVPSDLAQSLAQSPQIVIAAWFTTQFNLNACMILSSHEKGKTCLTKLPGRLSCEKFLRYNNSPPYVMARWLPRQIPPFKFPCSKVIKYKSSEIRSDIKDVGSMNDDEGTYNTYRHLWSTQSEIATLKWWHCITNQQKGLLYIGT